MYWWRIGDLRVDLVNGTLPERARFQYLLIFVVLSVVAMEFPLVSDAPNLWDRTSTVVAITFTLLGTTWLYRVNGGSRGRGFLERYLSLGWVFMLRFLAVSVPVLMVAVIAGVFAGFATDESGPFDVAIMTTWYASYYVGLGSQFRRVVAAGGAAQQGAESGEPQRAPIEP